MGTKIPVLSVYDEAGNRIPIPAIRGKSAYAYAQDGGYTGTEEDFAKKLAQDVPEGGGSGGEEWDVHYKVNIAEALPGGFEINEIDGNPLKLKEMWAFVKLQSAVDSAWIGCMVTTDNSGVILSAPTSGNGGVNANANVYAYFVYHAMVLPNSTRAICQIMASKNPTGSLLLTANAQWLNNWLEYNNINYITGLKCTNNLGAGTTQGYGTEIEIWGKSI